MCKKGSEQNEDLDTTILRNGGDLHDHCRNLLIVLNLVDGRRIRKLPLLYEGIPPP